ncbi:unnamed protein product [Cylicostephanus goldi]|uniref:Uncharacterized protein n=1 Tax=Cylicostephanus goldi TaxID=71465 RepID=A0A3P6TTA2_CYLGO|nr:unnamed protein product [Cylicostephanus goldi]
MCTFMIFSMRRAAGVHMRASRHRIIALTGQEQKKLAPSLKKGQRKELTQQIKAISAARDNTCNTVENLPIRFKK